MGILFPNGSYSIAVLCTLKMRIFMFSNMGIQNFVGLTAMTSKYLLIKAKYYFNEMHMLPKKSFNDNNIIFFTIY